MAPFCPINPILSQNSSIHLLAIPVGLEITRNLDPPSHRFSDFMLQLSDLTQTLSHPWIQDNRFFSEIGQNFENRSQYDLRPDFEALNPKNHFALHRRASKILFCKYPHVRQKWATWGLKMAPFCPINPILSQNSSIHLLAVPVGLNWRNPFSAKLGKLH